MSKKDDSLKKLLHRTHLTTPLSVFLESLSQTYPQIGAIEDYQPVLVGYEAANILLKTSQGEYFLKIFESDRQRKNIDSIVRVHIESEKIGVPVPKLIAGKEGYLSVFKDFTEIPYFITEKFNGKTFEFSETSLQDMSKVCEYLALLNTLSFPVVEAYDSWEIKILSRNTINLKVLLKKKKKSFQLSKMCVLYR